MKPIFQTRFGYPKGNCFMAAIASVMEVPLEDLPDLYEECCEWWDKKKRWTHGDWWGVTRRAMRERGWDLVCVTREEWPVGCPSGYAIAGGPSPRKGVVTEDGKNAGHVVVCMDGQMVHDPHPDGGGLAGPVEEWYIPLVPESRKAA